MIFTSDLLHKDLTLRSCILRLFQWKKKHVHCSVFVLSLYGLSHWCEVSGEKVRFQANKLHNSTGVQFLPFPLSARPETLKHFLQKFLNLRTKFQTFTQITETLRRLDRDRNKRVLRTQSSFITISYLSSITGVSKKK